MLVARAGLTELVDRFPRRRRGTRRPPTHHHLVELRRTDAGAQTPGQHRPGSRPACRARPVRPPHLVATSQTRRSGRDGCSRRTGCPAARRRRSARRRRRRCPVYPALVGSGGGAPAEPRADGEPHHDDGDERDQRRGRLGHGGEGPTDPTARRSTPATADQGRTTATTAARFVPPPAWGEVIGNGYGDERRRSRGAQRERHERLARPPANGPRLVRRSPRSRRRRKAGPT